jgi:hypothetical protein
MEDFSKLEDLLGIEKGSTKTLPEQELVPELVKGVDSKTKQLSNEFKQTSTELKIIDDKDDPLSIENLENSRRKIMKEAYELQEIGMILVRKLKKVIDDKIVVNEKEWASAGTLLTSVVNSLKTTKEIISQYRQEEEMKRMSEISSTQNEDDSLDLSPEKIAMIIQKHKEKTTKSQEVINAQDAEIVEPEKDSK